MLDAAKNFIKLTLSTGYDQNATSIVVSSGGASLPSPSFNVTWWNATDYADPSDDPNVEIVRVTAVTGNTLTITRGQESTVASAKNIGGKTYKLLLGVTAKMISDINSNLQQPWKLVTLTGSINGSNRVFTLTGGIVPFDANSLQVSLGRQPQIQGIDYTLSGTTITYVVAPDASLNGQPHYCQYQ